MKYHYEDWLKAKVEFDGLEVGCKGLCVGWEEPGHDVYPPEGEDEIVEIRIDYAINAETGEEVELTEEQENKAKELAYNSDDWWR